MKKFTTAFIWLPTVFLAVIGLVSVLWSGNLEPSAPPGPTMKTLEEIPPTWSRVLPASERYVLVMNNQAVLDRETGLVWEQAPSHGFSYPQTWAQAMFGCRMGARMGGRFGWRLPTVEEMHSVTDHARRLPSGHPFDTDCNDNQCVGDAAYWTASAVVDDANRAYTVYPIGGGYATELKSSQAQRWCVRGGYGYDGH